MVAQSPSSQHKAPAQTFAHRRMRKVFCEWSEVHGHVCLQYVGKCSNSNALILHQVLSFQKPAVVRASTWTALRSRWLTQSENTSICICIKSQITKNSWIRIAQTLCKKELVYRKVWHSLCDRFVAKQQMQEWSGGEKLVPWRKLQLKGFPRITAPGAPCLNQKVCVENEQCELTVGLWLFYEIILRLQLKICKFWLKLKSPTTLQ